jgi:hypothetical protein
MILRALREEILPCRPIPILGRQSHMDDNQYMYAIQKPSACQQEVHLPDPPSRYHLLRCLRSLLLATYCAYASVVAPRRLASDTLLMIRTFTKSTQSVPIAEFRWRIWDFCRMNHKSYPAHLTAAATGNGTTLSGANVSSDIGH